MGTFFAAYMLGQSLNIMTLGGLALAVGLIVDDAVVVIENIYRHLAMGEPPREAARNATAQIFTAVLASTITVITVFVPLLLIPGLQGLIFGPFALVIIVGVGISLLVATTTVPMLSSFMLDERTVHAAEAQRRPQARAVPALQRGLRPPLRPLRRRRTGGCWAPRSTGPRSCSPPASCCSRSRSSRSSSAS